MRISATLFEPLNFVRKKHNNNNNNNNISNSPQRQFFPLLFHLQPTKQRRKSRNCSDDGERPPVSDEVSYSSKTHERYAPAIPKRHSHHTAVAYTNKFSYKDKDCYACSPCGKKEGKHLREDNQIVISIFQG